MSALGHGAEALLEDGGQAALLVARRRIVADGGPVFPGVVFPPADPLQQRLGNFAADRASREQVLGTIDFGRLGQYRRAAVADDEVAGPSQGWVGGDAAVTIGAAAIQRHDQSTQGLG